MVLFGIKSCDTCRKAAKAIEKNGKIVDFKDVRVRPLSRETLNRFLKEFGDELANRRSTTWRNLSETERQQPLAQLLLDHPTLMKRPVIETAGGLTLGWDSSVQAKHLGEQRHDH